MKTLNYIKESINYIEKNLHTNLTPRLLSNMIHLSEFYYYRLFKNVVGTSVMDYIKKRRLSVRIYQWARAGKRPSLMILCDDLGYTSPSALTRAFKKSFNKTPSEYYKAYCSGSIKEIFTPFNFWGTKTMDLSNVYNKTMEFVRLESMILLGDTIHTTLNNNQNFQDVHDLCTRIEKQRTKVQHLTRKGATDVGLAYNCQIDCYLPDNVCFDYFRGYHVDRIGYIPKGFRIEKIDGGDYMRFITTSRQQDYERTLDYICGHIVLLEEVVLSNNRISLIEKFRRDVVLSDKHIEVELYIPVIRNG